MGIVHRDLKPENVLLDGVGAGAAGGRVRIADFNAALLATPGRALADGDVYARDAVGSAPYVAWEVERRAWYGKAVDWWALGCLAFNMLAGTRTVGASSAFLGGFVCAVWAKLTGVRAGPL